MRFALWIVNCLNPRFLLVEASQNHLPIHDKGDQEPRHASQDHLADIHQFAFLRDLRFLFDLQEKFLQVLNSHKPADIVLLQYILRDYLRLLHPISIYFNCIAIHFQQRVPDYDDRYAH